MSGATARHRRVVAVTGGPAEVWGITRLRRRRWCIRMAAPRSFGRHSGHTRGISAVAVASTTTVSGAPSRAKSLKR